MSTIKSSDEHLTLNADGSGKSVKFQANGVEKASISSAGAFTSTTIDATKLTGNLPAVNASALTNLTAANITGTLPAIDGSNLTGLSSFDPDGAVVFNESGADVNFRVEADDDANALFIEGANGNVGVGNTATQGELSVTTGGTNASGHTAGFQVRHNGYSGYKSGMSAGDTADTTHNCGFIGFLGAGHTGAGERHITFETRAGTTDAAGTERLRITSDGRGLSQFTAKAWIHISNNATINDSHNISSLSDMTTGRMKIYFSNNPGGSNYSISAITSKNGGGASSSNFGRVCIPEDKYSSYFQLFTQLGTSNTDTVYTSAVIFGD